MTKFMVFIDGSWLYANTAKLAADYGRSDLQIDYGVLPEAVSRSAAERLGVQDVDIVRTHIFGSAPENYDAQDYEPVRRRLEFFNLLREEHHYEVEIFPIDFRGRRIRASERDPDDPFAPKEKCVDIALATSMLYYAAIPHAYDIAVAIIGDQDYIPALQHVRRLARRVAICSIRGSCANEYADPIDTKRVKDTDVIWLNDMIADIELRYEPQQLRCESEFHVGDRKVWTTYRPRKSQPFFCDECRRIHVERQMHDDFDQDRQFMPARASGPVAIAQSERVTGMIYEIKEDRHFGFVRADTGGEYFFHSTDLMNAEWQAIDVGVPISFLIANEPANGRAGKAVDLRTIIDQDQD